MSNYLLTDATNFANQSLFFNQHSTMLSGFSTSRNSSRFCELIFSTKLKSDVDNWKCEIKEIRG